MGRGNFKKDVMTHPNMIKDVLQEISVIKKISVEKVTRKYMRIRCDFIKLVSDSKKHQASRLVFLLWLLIFSHVLIIKERQL